MVRLCGSLDDRIVGTCTLSLSTEEAGRRIATLQSSNDGKPVYGRIGFETVARYQLFAFTA